MSYELGYFDKKEINKQTKKKIIIERCLEDMKDCDYYQITTETCMEKRLMKFASVITGLLSGVSFEIFVSAYNWFNWKETKSVKQMVSQVLNKELSNIKIGSRPLETMKLTKNRWMQAFWRYIIHKRILKEFSMFLHNIYKYFPH